MSINTTSLNDLPTDPVTGGSVGGNVSLVTTETAQYSNNVIPTDNTPPSNTSSMTLDQNTISQIVNGLQQASISGMTSLPSRDIPTSTNNIISDPYVQPNYIPPPPPIKTDFINNEHLYLDYNRDKNTNTLDNLYDEIQNPLLLGLLYFMFQLPVFKRFLFHYTPFLFNTDANYNVQGLFFTSALFGFLYYLLVKIMANFSKF
jgi:hypothetical protein